MGAIVKKFSGFIRTGDGHGSWGIFSDDHPAIGRPFSPKVPFFFWKVKETSLQIKVSFCCCGIPCRIHTLLGHKLAKTWFFLQKNPEAFFIMSKFHSCFIEMSL